MFIKPEVSAVATLTQHVQRLALVDLLHVVESLGVFRGRTSAFRTFSSIHA